MPCDVKVTIYWRQTRNGSIKVETSLDKVPEDRREKYTSLTAVMRPMTWGAYNAIQKRCSKKSEGGVGEDLDWTRYKEEKIQDILVGWDAKDPSGKPIPVNQEAIFGLHPKIAETLLEEYDAQTLLGEDEKRSLVTRIHGYYFSSIVGNSKTASAPPELIEIGLMDKFGWTPNQIEEIPFGKMQRLFVAMEQKEQSLADAQAAKEHNRPKKKQH